MDLAVVEETLHAARRRLLSARVPAGHWEGELSSSALSTATAACALAMFDRAGRNGASTLGADLSSLVGGGLAWLSNHQNEDSGWGDTIDSPSNLSTTTLCWAALGVNESRARRHRPTIERAEAWLEQRLGRLTPDHLADAIRTRYGRDRTFSVPILTMCALSGRLGDGPAAWSCIPALPFELAACPHKWFRWLGLPVVSYALPALIAIGQARHHHRPTRNPLTRCLRRMTREKTLDVLQAIQPEDGGFLEAAPLTSFVLMSLVSIERADHPVAQRAASFLVSTVREDGSWPIDTNLATWVTTLAVGALAQDERLADHLSSDERAAVRNWLLGQQYAAEHPYTHAAPGAWAWTDLPGGVPDADDTPGALLALHRLADRGDARRESDARVTDAAARGVNWLLDLQNKDGGMPTFCRGWGKLPFDRSCPDLTAHALRAWALWRPELPVSIRSRLARAMPTAVRYLIGAQRGDGSWLPLWFGNQREPEQHNPLYGTARVLLAADAAAPFAPAVGAWRNACGRAVEWVLSAQNDDGGWGGAGELPSSIEETALAVEALAGIEQAGASDAISRGAAWLVRNTQRGTRFPATPIGLYFARLWYSERLYPLIFTVSALSRVLALTRKQGQHVAQAACEGT